MMFKGKKFVFLLYLNKINTFKTTFQMFLNVFLFFLVFLIFIFIFANGYKKFNEWVLPSKSPLYFCNQEYKGLFVLKYFI
jgi:hypothetical protein